MAAATPGSWSGLRFWLRATLPLGRHFGAEWPLVMSAGALGGLTLFRIDAGRAERLLVLFGFAIALAYPLLGVPFFSWYILPCLVAVIHGLAVFSGAVARMVASRASRLTLRPYLTAGAFGLLAFTSLASAWTFARDFTQAPYLQSYRRGAEWIKANSAPTDGIAYVEIGVLGYYSERPILDLMGLVTPQVRPYVLKNDILGAFREEPTAFVLFHTRGRMAPIVRSRWFRRRYEEVLQLQDSDGKGGLRIFRRKTPTEVTVPSKQ
jgi:predicted membrane channel-forming protein YqfA (hemolysin III family)